MAMIEIEEREKREKRGNSEITVKVRRLFLFGTLVGEINPEQFRHLISRGHWRTWEENGAKIYGRDGQ